MQRTVSAVYEDGVLKPLEALDLPEHQRVEITIAVPPTESADEAFAAWSAVYDGLSSDDLAEVERIALDRSRFMAPAG